MKNNQNQTIRMERSIMTNRITNCLLALALVVFTAGQAISAEGSTVKVDSKIASYKKVAGVAGNLTSIGSDTLNNLMTLWAESFRKHYPNVKIEIEGCKFVEEQRKKMGPRQLFRAQVRALRMVMQDAFERLETISLGAPGGAEQN